MLKIVNTTNVQQRMEKKYESFLIILKVLRPFKSKKTFNRKGNTF